MMMPSCMFGADAVSNSRDGARWPWDANGRRALLFAVRRGGVLVGLAEEWWNGTEGGPVRGCKGR